VARNLLNNLSGRVLNPRQPQLPNLPAPLPSDLVCSVLDAQDTVPERDRSSQPGYMHVSSLTDMMCPRRYAILVREERPIYRSVTGGHRVMWNIGRSVEAHIRTQYLRGTRRRGVFGKWACPCGEEERMGFYAADRRCGTCNKPLSVYRELALFDHDAKIVGNPDMLLDYAERLVVVEIKSMNAKQWDEIKNPLGNHVFQAGMYRHLLALNGYQTHNQVSILYCTKDFKWGSPYKEFHVDVTTPERVRLFENARDYARMLAGHAAAGTLPPRERCDTTTSKEAQSCPVVASCFNARD
jgi:hypothetical protein